MQAVKLNKNFVDQVKYFTVRAIYNFIKIYSPALILHSPPFLLALNYLAQQIKEVVVSNLIMNISLRIEDTTKEKSFRTADISTPLLDYHYI